MLSSYKEIKEEKRKRQKRYYNQVELIMDGKMKPIPEARRSISWKIRSMKVEIPVPKFR